MSAPNVLLLVIDSLRADAIFGDRVPTPNLDRLAKAGASFHQCIAATTSTTPSFSSMLTGCYPPKHGVRGLQGYRLSDRLMTMAELFGRAGYNTYAEVTGPLLPETGVLRGFGHARHRQGYRVPFFGWRDEVVASMRSYVEPWLMLLHVWEVHRPYRSPPDFSKRWDRAGYEAAVAATDEYLEPVLDAAGDDTIVAITGDHGEEYPENRLQHRLTRVGRRARETLNTGKWFRYLDRRLAALAVGHGFSLEEHLIKVPLIVAGPNVPDVAVTQQVRHVDLMPTIADLCDIAPPAGIDGRTVRPLMEGRDVAEEPAYMEAVGVKLEGDRIAGVRTSDWKLLRQGAGRARLYRLDGGPPADEKHDLSNRFPEVSRRLEAILDQLAEPSGAPSESGMTGEEEALVEQHLRDLGYL